MNAKHSEKIFKRLLLVIAISGAAGGLVMGFNNEDIFTLCLPGGTKFELGIIGSILSGAAASLAAYCFAERLFLINNDVNNEGGKIGFGKPAQWMKIISISILAGFMGMRLLVMLSESVTWEEKIRNVENSVEDVEKTLKFIRTQNIVTFEISQGVREMRKGDDEEKTEDKNSCFKKAELRFNRALVLDPDNVIAKVEKAKIISRRARLSSLVDEKDREFNKAIDLLGEVIREDRRYFRAYYNRACYKALKSDSKVKDFSGDLCRAISACTAYGEFAKLDSDFKAFRENGEFISLLNTLCRSR